VIEWKEDESGSSKMQCQLRELEVGELFEWEGEKYANIRDIPGDTIVDIHVVRLAKDGSCMFTFMDGRRKVFRINKRIQILVVKMEEAK